LFLFASEAPAETRLPFSADATITVDFAQPQRDGKRLVGFINAPFPEAEEDRYLADQIDPAFFRSGPTLLREYETIDSFGVDFKLLNVSTQIDWELPAGGDLKNDHKNPHLYPAEYVSYIENVAEYARDGGFDQDIVYSFWNEGNREEQFGGTSQDFLDVFVLFHDTLRRELGQTIKISGPSYGYFGTGIRDDDEDILLTDFMDNALEHGLVVNYLGLHLFPRIGIDFETTAERLDRYWEKFGPDSIYAPVGLESMIIDESMNDDDHLIPAAAFAWLHLLDRDDVDRASRTGLDDSETVCANRGIDVPTCIDLYGLEVTSDNGWNHSLNGAITHNELQPELEIGARSVWWPYRFYTDGRQGRVASSSDHESVVAIASLQSDEPDKTQVGIAYFGKNTLRDSDPTGVFKDIAVVYENVSAGLALNGATSVRVDIHRVPYDGDGLEILSEPELLAEGLVLPIAGDDTVTVELPGVWIHEVHLVKLYPLADPDAQPELSVVPPDLTIEVYEGSPESVQHFTISNAGGSALEWVIEEVGDSGRFTFDPPSGNLMWGESIDVEVRVDTLGLPEGEYLNSIEVTAVVAIEAPQEVVPVDLVVLDNEFPVAFDSSHTLKEEELLAFEVSFDDPDMAPGPYEVAVVGAPSGGTLTEISLGQFHYTPDPGFVGEDTVTWVANDGAADSNEAVVSLTVEGIPEIGSDTPVFDWTIYRGQSEVSTSWVLTNVGLGTLNWVAETIPEALEFVTVPASGVLEPGDSTTVTLSKDTTLAPAGTYAASLGILDSEARNHPFELPLSLEVLDHDTPVASAQSLITNEGDPLLVTLDYTDDGVPGPYSFTIGEFPLSGDLVENGLGRYLYTPDPGFVGADSFRWVVSDGALQSAAATAAIVVNQIPVANDLSFATDQETPVDLRLSYTDDGFPGTYSITVVSPPTNGTLVEVALGDYTYTPDPGFVGADSFLWKLNDGFTDSDLATVSLDVVGVAEVVTDLTAIEWTVFRGEPTASTELVLSNVGGAELNWDAQTLPASDIVTVTPSSGVLAPGASITLDVVADLSGLSDGVFSLEIGLLDPAERNYPSRLPVTLNILENATPIANDSAVFTSEEIPLSIALDYQDDGLPSAPTFTLTATPQNGSLVVDAPGLYTYTPNPGYVGSDSFTWTVSDGLLESEEATVSIGVNQIPIAEDQSVSLLQDTSVQIRLSFSDDGLPGPSLPNLETLPQNGTLVEDGVGLYTYTPNPGFVGADSFRFTVDDGLAVSEEATISIDVQGVATIATDRSVFNWNMVSGSDPITTLLQIQNVGGAVLNWAIETDPASLPISFEPLSGAIDPAKATAVTITVSAGGAPVGTYPATLAVTDPNASNGPFLIPINLTISEAVSP